MTLTCVRAVLPLILGSSLIAETIELKTGERIEGAFKQASTAGAMIEVGGESITIPLEKVQAIYFGLVPDRTGTSQARVLGPPPIVTKENYDQIQKGMTYEQVRAIIGVGGEEIVRNSIPGNSRYDTVMYYWKNSD